MSFDDFTGAMPGEELPEERPDPADFVGWLPVWKPVGITSYDAIRWLKGAMRGLKPRPKIGHTGTLDPFAEGLLLIALGGATRLIPLLEDWHKSYIATCRLGTLTDTLDPTGATIDTQAVPDFTCDEVEAAAQVLAGQVWQHPPAFSAVKQGGVASYKRARRGEEVDLPPRLVEIDSISILDIAKADPEHPEIVLEVTCGPGTYIRSLCRDLAVELGTIGHCAALQRTTLGPLTQDDCWVFTEPEEVTPDALRMALRPLDWPLEHLPFVSVGCTATADFLQGRTCEAEALEDPGGRAGLNQLVRVYTATGHFGGLGLQITSDPPWRIQPKTVLLGPVD